MMRTDATIFDPVENGPLRGGGPAVVRVRPPSPGLVAREGGRSLESGPAVHAERRARGDAATEWLGLSRKTLALFRVGVSRGRAYTHQAGSVSLGVRSRMSAPMLSATRADDALIESRARCAYRAVVSILL